MFCYKCGKSIPDESEFCPFCGAKAVTSSSTFCNKCGNQIIDGADFCNKCGAKAVTAEENLSNVENSGNATATLPSQAIYTQGVTYTPKNFGNILLESRNESTATRIKVIVYWIIMVASSIVLAIWLGVDRWYLYGVQFQHEYNAWFYIFLAIGVIEVVLGIISIYSVCTSKVTILENGVVGQGVRRVGRYLFWGLFYPGKVPFSFTYDQIESASVKNDMLKIWTQSESYCVIINNPLIYLQELQKKLVLFTDTLYCQKCNETFIGDSDLCPICSAKSAPIQDPYQQITQYLDEEYYTNYLKPINNDDGSIRCPYCDTTQESGRYNCQKCKEPFA